MTSTSIALSAFMRAPCDGLTERFQSEEMTIKVAAYVIWLACGHRTVDDP